MVKSQGMLESLKSAIGGKRGKHLLLFCRIEPFGKKRDIGEDREKYKYPLSPMVT
jgi:hypothetical protein